MANSAQARKRARQAEKNRTHNAAQRTVIRTHIKKVRKAIDSGDRAAAQAALDSAVPVLDRMAGKGRIHANKAARHKSRLNSQVHAMS